MRYSFEGRKPTVGNGTYISETAQVIGDVRIGDNCYVGHGCILRGDYGTIIIGKGTAVEEAVCVHAAPDAVCDIGEMVTLGHGAVIHCLRIAPYAVIGMGAVLGMGAEIGEWAIVAEGGIVKQGQKIDPRTVVGGNPARLLREVTARDEKWWSAGKKLYGDLARRYLTAGLIPLPEE